MRARATRARRRLTRPALNRPATSTDYRDKVQQNYYNDKHQDEAVTADCNQCIAIMDELMLRQPVWLQLSKTEWHSRTLSGNLGHSRESLPR